MRIALVGPVYPYRGGIAHYTTMLYRALRERGHEVLLVSFKRQYPQWLFPGKSDKDPSDSVLRVDEARYWIDSLNPFTWWRTFARIREYAPDAVVLQWWTTFWAPTWYSLALLNSLFLRSPVLFICHNVLPHETRIWDRWLAFLVLQWGKRFVVSSESERKRLYSLLPRAEISTIPLPPIDLFSMYRVSKTHARERLRLPREKPVILFFGIIREYKGLIDLIAAMPIIRQYLEEVWLLIVGEFWDSKEPYLTAIEQLDLDRYIVVTDRYVTNEEAALYFSAADVLVAPYRSATGSAVVQTASAFGIPVITTFDFGESVKDGRVTLVEPENVDTLAKSVVSHFQNSTQSSQQGICANNQASSSWSKTVDEIRELGFRGA